MRLASVRTPTLGHNSSSLTLKLASVRTPTSGHNLSINTLRAVAHHRSGFAKQPYDSFAAQRDGRHKELNQKKSVVPIWLERRLTFTFCPPQTLHEVATINRRLTDAGVYLEGWYVREQLEQPDRHALVRLRILERCPTDGHTCRLHDDTVNGRTSRSRPHKQSSAPRSRYVTLTTHTGDPPAEG